MNIDIDIRAGRSKEAIELYEYVIKHISDISSECNPEFVDYCIYKVSHSVDYAVYICVYEKGHELESIALYRHVLYFTPKSNRVVNELKKMLYKNRQRRIVNLIKSKTHVPVV